MPMLCNSDRDFSGEKASECSEPAVKDGRNADGGEPRYSIPLLDHDLPMPRVQSGAPAHRTDQGANVLRRTKRVARRKRRRDRAKLAAIQSKAGKLMAIIVGIGTLAAAYYVGWIDGKRGSSEVLDVAEQAMQATEDAAERVIDAEVAARIWKNQADACNKRRRQRK